MVSSTLDEILWELLVILDKQPRKGRMEDLSRKEEDSKSKLAVLEGFNLKLIEL